MVDLGECALRGVSEWVGHGARVRSRVEIMSPKFHWLEPADVN
jgi:hypothetical protein